jgi:hypothetical protein
MNNSNGQLLITARNDLVLVTPGPQSIRIPAPRLPLLRSILIALNASDGMSFLLGLIFLWHFNETLQWVPTIAVSLGIVRVIASLPTNNVTRVIVIVAALGLLGADSLRALVLLVRNAGCAEGRNSGWCQPVLCR